MRLNYNEELNKLMSPYLEDLLKNKANLRAELIPLFDLIMEDFDREGRYGLFEEKIEPLLEEIIRNEKIQSIAHLFDGKLKELLRYTLGDEYASLFHTYLQLQSRCPYTSGYSRRSQRCAAPDVHLSNIRYTWIEFLKLRATGFSEIAILNEGNTPEQIELIRDCLNSAAWIAAQIAQGNQTVIEYIRQVLTSENNANLLKKEHFAAIAKSGHRELLELEGKLLLAAKLQEGLRQSIIETMDEGCTESYLYLFSLICDYGLQHYASVKRGIAVATGIGEMASERITNQIIELIRSFLNNPKLAQNALKSKNTLELYLALWSIGFYNVDEIKVLVSGFIKKGAKHQVQTLLHFLRCTQSNCINHHNSKEVFEKWRKDPSVVVAILPLYLNDVYLNRYNMDEDTPELKEYFDHSQEAVRHYEYLKQLSLSVSAEEHYSPFVFPWDTATLTRSDIICRMMYIAWMTNDKTLKDDLCKYLPALDSYQRANYIEMVLNSPTSDIQQTCVLQALGDRSADVRGSAYNVLNEMNLTPEQYRSIEELLRFKYSEMRINAINLLMKQPKEQLADSVRRLLADKDAERRLAGLDIMKNIRYVEHLKDIYAGLIASVKEIKKPNAKEKVLIESLIGKGKENSETINYTKENGFGFYNPALDVTLPPIKPDAGFDKRKVFEFILCGKAKASFEKLNEYIKTYKDKEFKSEYGEARLVGNTVTLGWHREGGLEKLGFPELWKAFYEKEIGSYDKLLMMQFMLISTGSPTETIDSDEDDEEEEEDTQSSPNTFEPIINQMYAGITYRGLQKELRDLPYYNQMESIVNALAYDYRDEVLYQELSVNMLLQLLPLVHSQNIFQQYLNKRTWLCDKQKYGEKLMVYPIHANKFVNFWLDTPKKPIDDALFARYFTVHYQLYKLTNYMEHTPELEENESYMRSMDFARAWLLGMIPDGEVYREMLGRIKSPNRMGGITMVLFDGYRNSTERKEFSDLKGFDFSTFRPLAQNAINRILEIELKRGDSETQVTKLAAKLRRVYGAEVLIRILQAFGKDTFMRDSYNWNNAKRGVLSNLLLACHPLPTDTGKLLKKIAREGEISDVRLVEAAMFSPQWMELVEEATGWKGLTSAAYYFHAHTCTSCDDKTKAIIARYTPIDAADLCEGVFDINWFKDAYKTIGKERFEVVYNSAKYISSSNSHTRARKFADAASGKLKAAEVKKEIIARRNKDLLMSYGLIPLDKKDDKELLERYQYLQQFLKESKKYGAQRQESEKKAANIALQNLALSAGYGDITRLTWSMETELIKELLPYLTPKELEGVEVYVSISDNGKSEIKQTKDGKELNSLPAKLKKHPYIEELKAVHKKLKDQYTCSRIMLEQAMEDGTRFEERELRKLMQNPVIWPLLKNLVFTCNGQTGFYSDKQLIAADGACTPLKANNELRIAHPTDLYTSGHWHTFQRLLFDKEIRQSFKQVFRELYVPTPEEMEATQSRRYAGNQIQPQKTVAALKGRRWIADYQDGLQKIYYKENIIATIYAKADWFSPADIEAPTLEHVCFYNRRDHKLMKISEIPTAVFSEVMRDVDLAVSVAHAGSVDPETSHSTIEMRRVLVELTMPLFHLNHVTVKGSFAHIEGKLGTYNIHLGSGVIHQEGGAQIAVLAVHSQHRGRLFLPFVDEDPKTAEILTKIIFFADDEKIKDPSILNQIKKNIK